MNMWIWFIWWQKMCPQILYCDVFSTLPIAAAPLVKSADVRCEEVRSDPRCANLRCEDALSKLSQALSEKMNQSHVEQYRWSLRNHLTNCGTGHFTSQHLHATQGKGKNEKCASCARDLNMRSRKLSMPNRCAKQSKWFDLCNFSLLFGACMTFTKTTTWPTQFWSGPGWG